MKSLRGFAIAVGIGCHAVFAIAVGLMALRLFSGIRVPLVDCPQWLSPLFLDILLLLQFPLVHSFLLTESGTEILLHLSPTEIASQLKTTWFSTIASLQLLSVFVLWQPSGVVLYSAEGGFWWLWTGLYLISWLLLILAMKEAGLGLQTGYSGWLSAAKGCPVRFAPFPRRGLAAQVRHPMYLAYAAILWTAPVWTLDRILLASVWSLYCFLGPLHKERRYRRYYPKEYAAYARDTPYMVPRLFRRRVKQQENAPVPQEDACPFHRFLTRLRYVLPTRSKAGEAPTFSA